MSEASDKFEPLRSAALVLHNNISAMSESFMGDDAIDIYDELDMAALHVSRALNSLSHAALLAGRLDAARKERNHAR